MKHFLLIVILSFSFALAQNPPSYNDALEFYKNGKHKESIETLRAIIKEQGKSYEIHYLAGHNYWKLGNYSTALQHLNSAFEKKSDDPNIYIDLVKLYFLLGKSSESMKLCEEGLRKFTDNYDLKLNKISLLVHNNSYKEALEVVEQLKTEHSNDYRIFSLEAKIYLDTKQYDKSEMSLNWAIDLAPTNAGLKNNLAILYEKVSIKKLNAYKKYKAKGDKENAATKLQQSINFVDKAEVQIQKAVEGEPENPTFLKNKTRIKQYKERLKNVD